MVTKGIYLFWDNKYEQVIYAGRFTGRKRIKDHFQPSLRHKQKINEYVQNHPDRVESVIFCEFDDISDNDLNQLEMETIKLFKLNKYRHPNSHVFNFTDGGGGMCGFIHSEENKRKITENRPDVSGKNNPFYGEHHTEESKKKISENVPDRSGENNPNAKYTLWDSIKCNYMKGNMFQKGNGGMNPRRCFSSKYNGRILSIGMNLDFYTPELINDLINEFLEVS